jgi:hypothetical protein
MAHIGFEALTRKLAARGDISNPKALAASIGRKKFGAKGMAKKSAAGRRKKKSYRKSSKS